MTNPDGRTTSFGYSDVPEDEKAARVRGVFDSVATNYDLMNDLMSAGVHRIWKSTLLDRLNPQPGMVLLDVAGGTGDVALGFLKRADTRPRADALDPARAIICDINAEMLVAGAARDGEAGTTGRSTRVCGDAERLPLPEKSVDAYTIAFGIRNVTNMDAALAEAYRVLKPGGRFICLEFSHMITEGLQRAYDAYSFNVIPWLGERVTKDRAAYQYLVESIRRFPNQDAFADRIEIAGFRRVTYENLTAGVAALHMGWRL
ncbi:MAG: class I SAM-dependent methyltransferase [Pseudomonadota bacterium]